MPSDADIVLRLVWQGSLLLALVSITIALGLAAKRFFEERARARLAVRQAEISRLVQALLASPRPPDASSLPPLLPGDEPALFSVALDILRVTRGRDAQRMLALTELWNLKPYLKRQLASRHRNRKIRALTLLSYYEDPESLDLLLDQIHDSAIYVQLAAVRGVADRGNVQNLPLIVKALAAARETNVAMLADILRRFGEPAVPALSELARTAAAQGVRLAAVTALGSIGSLKAFPLLDDLSRDPEPAIRTRALQALAQLGDPRAESAIGDNLIHADARVRAAAAQAAGLLGLREALASLAGALHDEAWEVRYRAAESLFLLGAPGLAALRSIAGQRPDAPAGAGSAASAEPGDAEGLAAEMAAELLAEKLGVPA